MSAAGWRSEGGLPRERPELGYADPRVQSPKTSPERAPPRRQRAEGSVAIAVESLAGGTILARKAESGSARVRLPRVPGPWLEAVLINTAGGLAGGDRMAYEAVAGEGGDLVVTSAAAEKVYKADAQESSVAVNLRLGPRAGLAWIPQESILFDRARLVRRLEVDMAADARLLVAEATVFGRVARGEEIMQGLCDDRWRIRRGGRLVYADRFRLAGAVAVRLQDRAVAAGARAIATLLYVAPDAEARVDEARAALEGAACECGAGAWNGCLAVRFLAPDVARLRQDLSRVIATLGRRPLPRVWHL